ncbi:MAG: TM0106 family RecB-like putative nuclease [Propionibacteriaceae bacterium]|jgi:predicted RecB family nuclease|nr:TM0106 family RecB-like putative nuclease [Propionibacteriaceae bacterium]
MSDLGFTLDAYAARDCPVKVQNRFDAALSDAPDVADDLPVSSEISPDSFATTDANRQAVFARLEATLLAAGVSYVNVSEAAERAQATRDAVAAGVHVIIAPALRSDYATHRASRPDVLVREGTTATGGPGYLPVQIKMHRVVARTTRHDRTLLASTFAAPFVTDAESFEGWALRDSQGDDLIQLAHYWRHLEDLDWASATQSPLAGLITTDTEPLTDAIVWNDLTEKRIRVYARTRPDEIRTVSALERYDHEFAFRVKVATTTQAHHGTPDDPTLMLEPVRIPECKRCQWWSACVKRMGAADLSVQIDKSPLDVHETLALRGLGVVTVADLAAANLDQLLPEYLPLVGHQQEAEERLRLAAHRARLINEGVEVERRRDTGPMNVPRASFEIDFDIETSRDGRVYLWGFLVCEDGVDPYYVHFSRFEALTVRSEGALAKRALTWLADTLREHPEALVYHYSNYELIHIDKFKAQPCARQLLGEFRDRFVDLFSVVKGHFFGVHGLGLKAVASAGAGFSWRDPEASGLNSQSWFDEAITGDDEPTRTAAGQRVLEYNEDDVRATLALRTWLATFE